MNEQYPLIDNETGCYIPTRRAGIIHDSLRDDTGQLTHSDRGLYERFQEKSLTEFARVSSKISTIENGAFTGSLGAAVAALCQEGSNPGFVATSVGLLVVGVGVRYVVKKRDQLILDLTSRLPSNYLKYDG